MYRHIKHSIFFFFLTTNIFCQKNIFNDSVNVEAKKSSIYYDECLVLIDSTLKTLNKDIAKAKELSLRSVKYAYLANEDSLILRSTKITSLLFGMLHNPDSALRYAKIAAFHAKKLKSQLDLVAMETFISQSLIKLGEHKEAYHHLMKSEQVYKILNDTAIDETYMFFKLTKAGFFFKLELIDLAFAEYFELEKLADSIQDSTFLMQIYGGLAVLYKKIKDYDQATFYNKKCLANKYSKDVDVAIVYVNIGNTYAEFSQLDSAKFYYDKARAYYLKRNAESYNLNYVNIAEVQMYVNAGDLEKAKSIIHNIDTNSLHVEQKSNYYLLKIFLTRDIDEKLKLALVGVDYSVQANILENQKEYYKNLYKIYEIKGFDQLALKSLKKYQLISDSIFNENKSLAIQKIVIQNTINKKDKEAKENQLIYDNQIITESRKFWIVLSLLLGLLIIVVFLYQKTRLSKQKSSLIQARNKLLENENRQSKSDLEKISFEWEKGKNFLKQTKDELKRIRLSDEKESKINSLFALTNQFVLHEEQKIDLQEKIKEVQDSFFSKLDELGKLTKTEKKLAALLSLGLASKQIALILNVSEKTIEMYRFRLRKKLKISSEVDLNIFFKSL